MPRQARLETPGALHISPAAIHYAAVRGEKLLREDSGLERQLRDYLSNLVRPLPSVPQGKYLIESKEGGKMKTLFQAFAKYNGSVNRSILEIVEPLKKEQVMMETKAYYPSIFETLLHNFIADRNYLKRFRDAFKENKGLNSSGLLSLEDKSLRKEFESDYTKFFQYRKQMDEVIIQFVNELDESKLDSVIRYKNYKGEDVEKEIWKTLLHWFNHQTHHRGQVSVLLDMVGVDHDFSSMVTRI